MQAKRILRSSSWLFLDRFFRMAVGFLVGVVIARHYGPAANGELAYVVATAAILGSLGSLGLDEIGPRDFAAGDLGVPKADIERTAVILRLLSGGLAYLIFLAFIFFKEGSSPILLLAILYGLYLPIQATDVVEYRLRAEGRFGMIAGIRSVASLVSGGLKLGAVFLGFPLIAIAGAMGFEYVMGTTAYLFLRRRKDPEGVGRFSWNYARDLLRRSSFLIIAGTFSLLQGRVDSLLIEHFLDLEALGQYAAALKLMELFDTGAIVLSIVLVPEFARASGKALETLARRAYLAGGCLYLLSIPLIYFVAWLFPFIYGSSYTEGESLIPYLVLRPLLVMMGFFRAGLAVAEGKQSLLPLYPLVGSLATWFLASYFIPEVGLRGAALSSIGGLLFSNLIVDLLVYRRHLVWMLSAAIEVRPLLKGFKA